MGDPFSLSDLPPPNTNEDDLRALTDWLAEDSSGRPPPGPACAPLQVVPPPFPGYLGRASSGAESRARGSGHLAPQSVPSAGLYTVASGAAAEASSAQAGQPETTQGSGNSGTGNRSGRSTASMDEDEKKRVREKNKHAQKRYREKQRDKMADMEQRSEMLKGQLERVAAESAALQRRNQVLSKLVELKQTHITTLTEVVKNNEDRRKSGKENGDPPAACSGAAAVHGLSPVTIEQCRTMQHADIVQRWRAYAERMASLLIEAEMPNPTQDCVDRLNQVCKDCWHCLQTMALSKPMVLKLLLVSNLQTGRWDDPRKNDEAFWRAAIAPLQIDVGQQEQLLYVASMFMGQIQAVHKQHSELSARVLELLPQTRGERRVAAIVQLADTMLTVQQTLTKSDQEGISFATITLAEILTPIQFARFATQAYPLFPNPVQIVKLLLTDMSDEQRAKMSAASRGVDTAKLHAFVEKSCDQLAKVQLFKFLMNEMPMEQRAKLSITGLDMDTLHAFAERACERIAR